MSCVNEDHCDCWPDDECCYCSGQSVCLMILEDADDYWNPVYWESDPFIDDDDVST